MPYQKNPGFIQDFAYTKTSQIPSPSLAGQTVIVNQAVLLAPDLHSSAPSQGLPQ